MGIGRHQGADIGLAEPPLRHVLGHPGRQQGRCVSVPEPVRSPSSRQQRVAALEALDPGVDRNQRVRGI
ncbi:MAG: hypothetical protein QOF44_592 [Streptomyces sp.]|nr:hypothetical protein [Streptomyces sp.]